jgi:hypothetical protein
MSPNKPAAATPQPVPVDSVRAIAQLADTLGHASTSLFNYRRGNPDAANLDQVLNLETTLDQRTIDLRTQAIRLLGANAADAVAQLQDAAQRVDAFLVDVKTIEGRLTLASAVIGLASAALVGDAGGILSSVVSVHAALKAAA